MVFPALLTLACLSCTDNNPHLPNAPDAMEVTPLLRCTVDVRSANVSCIHGGPATAGGASYAILGNDAVKLRYTNGSYDSLALVYGVDVTAQNLRGFTIGTPDGQTQTGLKVFFETLPRVVAYKSPGDTGTISLINHDGTQNITAASQPYFFYDTILPNEAVTSAKRWKFHVPRTVHSFTFEVRVFTANAREARVPMSAPTIKPAWFNDPDSLVRFGNSQIMVVQNVVRVQFRADASQEERQSAVNMVGGRVVGGGGGFYYVRVPTNGTLPSLESYFVTLSRLPQVSSATPFIVSGAIDMSYQKAYDTVGWREWKLNPDSADDQNWALERIGAPFGWGCSCGDTLTTVAVIDQGFHAQPDLAGNADLSGSIGWNAYAGAADSIDHGTRVAAILTARGNDSSQVTGAMWRSRLLMYDVSTDSAGAPLGGIRYENVWSYLRRAARQGARVINMSMGISWRDSVGQFRNPAIETDSAARWRDSVVLHSFRADLEISLDSVTAQGHDPLLVVSAGNNGIDARWNGYETATHANRVLSVAASNRSNGLSSFSNRGALVEIAAPGEAVHVLWGNGRIDSVRTLPSGSQRRGSGTSFSAPHVAGVAGLLFSFDPRLTAPEAKTLLIKGAVRGQRAAGGIPILNAHESLILAGRRAGAPLCGNRLWIADGKFFAQRDTASATGEELFPAPISERPPVAFNALHGGKQVMFFTRPVFTGRQWSANGWTTIPYSGTGPDNASFLSRAGLSHDRDSTVVLQRDSAGPRTSTYRLFVRTAAGEVPLPNVITDSVYDDPGLCVSRFVEVPAALHEGYMNHDSAKVRESYMLWRETRGFEGNCMSVGKPTAAAETLQFLAYAPVGQQAYVFIVRRRSRTSPTGSRPCDRSENINHMIVFYKADCIDAVTVYESAGTAAYRVDVRNGAIVPLTWTEPSLELWSPMIREDGREILVQRQKYRATTVESWYEVHEGGVSYRGQTHTSTTECTLQFRDLQSGTIHLSPGACLGAAGGQGGISAVRTPGS